MSELTQRRIAIPYFYKWIAQDCSSPGETFKRYVAAYVRHNYPGWELNKIERMNALIERRIDQ